MNNQEFREFLVNNCRLDPTKPVLVGFSGGPDSLYLLHRLKAVGVNVIAGHVDHSLRPTSTAEAAYVAVLCGQWQIPFVTTKIDVETYARERKLSIEEAARDNRYRFLFDEAEKIGAQAVLVAHHADDQVETVLMHFLRGSGTSGLAGMQLVFLPNPWSGTIPLVRPLLHTWRNEIIDYCQLNELKPVLDDSNTDTTYFRNRIRSELIPILETYNPTIKESVLRTAAVTSTDEAFLQQEVDSAWQEVVTRQSEALILFNRSGVIKLHAALQRRLVRKAIETLKETLRDIDFASVEKAVQFIQKPNHRNHVELMAGLEMFACFKDSVVIMEKGGALDGLWPQMYENELVLPMPCEVKINRNWTLSADYCRELQAWTGDWDCSIDAEKITGELKVRAFQPGDRFTPFGMNGKTLKLGDFWTNAGLLVCARGKWPLIVDDDKIVWVPGFRISEDVRVTAETKKMIHLQLNQK